MVTPETTSTTLRPLAPSERFFWLANQMHPVPVPMVGEVRGRTTVAQWRQALDRLQARHPLLSVCIDRDETTALCFQRSSAPIPLRVLPWQDGQRWEPVVEGELATPFDAHIGPLVRAVLLHGPDTSVVVMVAHHCIADAKSVAFLIRDLLTSMSQGALDPMPLPRPLEAWLGMPPVPPLPTAAEQMVGQTVAHLPAAHIRTLSLGDQLSARVVEGARREGTTVHGALCAALLTAGRELWTPWRGRALRVLSPIDLRRRVGAGDDCALLISAGMAAFADAPLDFWALARSMTDQMRPQRTHESAVEHARMLHGIQSGAAGPQEPDASGEVPDLFGFEMLLTNLGVLDVPTDHGPLGLTALWGPCVVVDLAGEKVGIGVSTLAGTIRLVQTSRVPLALLDTAARLLALACTEGPSGHPSEAAVDTAGVSP